MKPTPTPRVENGSEVAPPLAVAPVHTLSAREVEAELETGSEGLTEEEAQRRLERYGPNEVEEEAETPWWAILLHQFRDPLIYILLIGAVITLLLRDYTDTGVILAVVVLNAIIGFVQEYRAQQAMQALARLSAPKAEMVRDGELREVPSRELVPGDLVVLTSGARVPADLLLVQVRDLEGDEIEGIFTWRSVVVKGGFYLLSPDGPEHVRAAWQRGIELLRRLLPETLDTSDPVPFRNVLFRIAVQEATGREARPAMALAPTPSPGNDR